MASSGGSRSWAADGFAFKLGGGTRNQQGEQLVTMGALYALFDALLRRQTSDGPLLLSQLMNGAHVESRA